MLFRKAIQSLLCLICLTPSVNAFEFDLSMSGFWYRIGKMPLHDFSVTEDVLYVVEEGYLCRTEDSLYVDGFAPVQEQDLQKLKGTHWAISKTNSSTAIAVILSDGHPATGSDLATAIEYLFYRSSCEIYDQKYPRDYSNIQLVAGPSYHYKIDKIQFVGSLSELIEKYVHTD